MSENNLSELLFLLLPVAAAYGWYMGRRSTQQSRQQNANRLSREYVAGVNFLLSNQKDKAVDLFLTMLREGSSDVDAHLTLGNLFRSRGEIERAIRIHQALMENHSLTFEQRLLAIAQLGCDYMAAGLYDRAEDMFNQLIEENDFRIAALQQLLIIYQMTSDWLKAITVSEKLLKIDREQQKNQIAHFYCELALLEVNQQRLDDALVLLKKASAADEHCARVSVMTGRIFIMQNKFVQAIHAFERVLPQDKEIVSEILPELHDCYEKTQQPGPWRAFLTHCVKENTGAMAELMLADIIEQQDGRDAAHAYIHRQLQHNPTLRVFHRLMDYHLADAEAGRAKESLLLLQGMVDEQIRTKPHYRCNQCGFAAHVLYWQCPSCKAWAAVKPLRGLDG